MIDTSSPLNSDQIIQTIELMPEEDAVLAPIQELFDGVARRDKTAMLAVLLPDGRAASVQDGQILRFSLRTLVDRLPAGTEPIEEHIYDPLIRIDEDIAMVWASYEFFVNGRPHHWGSNLFNLVRHDDRWLIAGVAYNSRLNCESKQSLPEPISH